MRFHWVGFRERSGATSVLALGCLTLALTVSQAGLEWGFTFWQRAFIDSFTAKAVPHVWELVVYLIGIFGTLAFVARLRPVARTTWSNRLREIRFAKLIERYFSHSRFVIGQQAHTDPDVAQRLADDLGSWAGLLVELSDGGVLATLKFGLFAATLWLVLPSMRLGTILIPAPMALFSVATSIAMLAVIYLAGRRLPECEAHRLERTAELRAVIARAQEHALPIGLLGGGEAEARTARERLSAVSAALHSVASIRGRVAAGNAFFMPSDIAVFLLLMPLYLHDQLTLGTVFQITLAHNGAGSALGWFVAYYGEISQLRAARSRVRELDDRLGPVTDPDGSIGRTPGNELRVSRLVIFAPPAAPGTQSAEPRIPLRTIAPFRVASGERVLLRAPSGFGKSILMAVLTGCWPWASGQVMVPRNAVWIPQRAYFPHGTLLSALSYPDTEEPTAGETERLLEALGLAALVPRLRESAPWNHVLSGGELARLALARAILQRPSWIFMDEPTAALDVEAARRYWELVDGLHQVSVVLIAHTLAPPYDQWRVIKLDQLAESSCTVETGCSLSC